jgi:hypothetical protein
LREPIDFARSGVVWVARGIAVGVAVGSAVIVPAGNVTGERHVPSRHLQQLALLGGIAQPLGRPQASRGHPLISLTRRHG